MLIVLPPSETKAHGGQSAPLDFAALSFPELNPYRRSIASTLSNLKVDEAMEVLKLSEKLRGEAESNRELMTSPTMPALNRYTGVLYDALDPATIDDWSQLAVGSALFGVVGGADLIPHYRLSAGSKLEGRTMKSRWGASISTALEAVDGLILDLRSGNYQALGKVSRAVTVRVETPDGKVVSHFNKHYKGLLARELAATKAETAKDVAELAQAAGLNVAVTSPTALTMVVER